MRAFKTLAAIFVASLLALPVVSEAASPKPYRPRNAAERGHANKLFRSFQGWFSGSAATMAKKAPFARQATALREQGYAFVPGAERRRAGGEATRARTLRPKGKRGAKPYTRRQLRFDPFAGRPERGTEAKDGVQQFLTRGELDGRIVSQHVFTLGQKKTVKKLRRALAAQLEREGYSVQGAAEEAAYLVRPGQRVLYIHTWEGSQKVSTRVTTINGRSDKIDDVSFPLR